MTEPGIHDFASIIFQISNPHSYWCRVSHLASAHSTMQVDVFRFNSKFVDRAFVLYFRKVEFFAGWLTWIGADFRLATDDEKLEFIRSNATNEPNDDELLVGTVGLFVCIGEQGKNVRILANGAGIADSNDNLLVEIAPSGRLP